MIFKFCFYQMQFLFSTRFSFASNLYCFSDGWKDENHVRYVLFPSKANEQQTGAFCLKPLMTSSWRRQTWVCFLHRRPANRKGKKYTVTQIERLSCKEPVRRLTGTTLVVTNATGSGHRLIFTEHWNSVWNTRHRGKIWVWILIWPSQSTVVSNFPLQGTFSAIEYAFLFCDVAANVFA